MGKAKKKASGKEAKVLVFTSKNGGETSKMKTSVEGCKASQVVFDILSAGVPEGGKLIYAKSYNGHYLSRKGKNALGFFDTKDLLVVNGIAAELEKEGVKGIVAPSSTKNYQAIRLAEMKDKDLKVLISTIKRVLGIGKTGASKAKTKAPKEEAVETRAPA